jgi:hypothetical protein
MRKNYWNAITIALGACAMPHLIAQVNLDPSRPIASAVLSGSPNPATYGKIGNLNWETSQAMTQANLKGITEFSGNPHVQELESIFNKARTEYIKLDKDLTGARNDLNAKQDSYNSSPSTANAQALEAAVKVESDINKKIDAQNQILSAVAPIVTIVKTEVIAEGGQRPLILDQNKGVVTRATEKAQNEPSYKAISGAVQQYNSGIKGEANLESIVTNIRGQIASGQRAGDKNSDGFIDASQLSVKAAQEGYKNAPEDVSKLISYAQNVQNMFNEYAPVTEEFKANVIGEVLNGSWERNAINDIAGKGGIIESETQARTAADVALDGKLTTEVDGLKAADVALGSKLTTEVTGLQAADVALGSKLTTAVTDLKAADGVLDGKLTTVTTAVTDLKAADVALDGKFTTEVNGLKAADVALGSQIAIEKQERISAVAASLIDAKQYTDKGINAETQARIVGDSLTLTSAKAYTTEQVAAEGNVRKEADLLLDEKIIKESGERKAAIIEEARQRIEAIEKEEKSRLAAINVVDKKFTEQVDGLGRRVFSLENRMNSAENVLQDHETRLVGAEENIQQLQRGVAMVAALQTPVIEYGSNNAMKFSMANYGSENGFSFGYARRLFKGFSADVEAATTSQFEEAVIRGGINFSW